MGLAGFRSPPVGRLRDSPQQNPIALEHLPPVGCHADVFCPQQVPLKIPQLLKGRGAVIGALPGSRLRPGQGGGSWGGGAGWSTGRDRS